MRRLIGPALQNTSLDNNNTFTSANSTQTRPIRSLRPPLQSRDHNVIMRVPPKSPLQTKSGNGNNMPSSDKQITTRPFMPTLSAAAVKTSNRTPLTPRVAGSAPATASTPTASRPRSEIRTPGGAREDISTPVSTFLSHNITPRSGSRKSRVDSTNTTPTGTPNGTPAPPSVNETFRVAHDSPYGSGLGISGVDKDVPKRPTVSFSLAVSDIGSSKGLAHLNFGESKFFFASDVKTAQAPRPQLPPLKSSTFFYANGGAIPAPPQSSNSSAVGSTVADEISHPKFFHANGTLDIQASPSPHFHPPRPSSVISSSSRITSPRLPAGSPGTLSPIQRPTSPSKLNQQASTFSLKGQPVLPSAVLPRPQVAGRGQSTNSVTAARRASIEGSRVVSHGRSASVGSTDSKGPSLRKISGGSKGDAILPPSPSNLIATSVPVSTPEEVTEVKVTKQDVAPEIQSPTKAGHSLEHMNELAANARRERKVLDLEITNSSLAAINRTLEREMRKQNAELRRYRRLSRSGRLSITTNASTRTSSASLSMMDGVVDGTHLSDMSEEGDSEEEHSDFSEESSVDDGTLSPDAMAESDLRHRRRDEKRLQLDLSKHQQLLIDSQKMNQSLKRCLGLTEEMINEGKKSLAYSVRVSDVELGGRVLAPDEMEDENEGMGDIGTQFLEEARLAAANGTSSLADQGREDRDSGIELEGAQAERIDAPTPQ